MLKKLVLVLICFFLMTTSVLAITLEEARAIQQTANELETTVFNLRKLMNRTVRVLELETGGWVTISPEQNQALIALYGERKQAIADKYQELP